MLAGGGRVLGWDDGDGGEVRTRETWKGKTRCGLLSVVRTHSEMVLGLRCMCLSM